MNDNVLTTAYERVHNINKKVILPQPYVIISR